MATSGISMAKRLLTSRAIRFRACTGAEGSEGPLLGSSSHSLWKPVADDGA